jgi:hypothetical protein
MPFSRLDGTFLFEGDDRFPFHLMALNPIGLKNLPAVVQALDA